MALEVLVVDDEADIRELLVLTLERMGLDVESAASVTEAQQKLERREFALCLTDMRLPDGDGSSSCATFSSSAPARRWP